MIEATLIKIVFSIPCLWNIYISDQKRPFSLLEIGIIVWGCCFIAGWYLTGKRVYKLYEMEGFARKSDDDIPKVECFDDKVKSGLLSVAWMLEVNDKFTFFFKSLYWFSYAYVHSLFIFIVLAAIAYTVTVFNIGPDVFKGFKGELPSPYYEFKDGDITKNESEQAPKQWYLPPLWSMSGAFVFFNSKFILMHVSVFLISFIAFYVCCVMFLKVENDESNGTVVSVNRLRFKYILYVSYIFVDCCYMLFEFVLMFFHAPKYLTDSINEFKQKQLNTFLGEIIKEYFDPYVDNDDTDIKEEPIDKFKRWLYSNKRLNKKEARSTYSGLVSLVRKLPNRDKFINNLLKPI